MKSPLYPALGLFVALPSIALAQEPAKGTLIMVSSVGLWVLGSSVLLLRKGSKESRGEAVDESSRDDVDHSS